jgi:hypothetical protein
MNADGSGGHRIASATYSGPHTAWSTDNQWVAAENDFLPFTNWTFVNVASRVELPLRYGPQPVIDLVFLCCSRT